MVRITTESTSDLEHLFESEGIPALALYVDLDGKTFRDGEDLSAEGIFAKYEEKKVLPKTAARSIDDYIGFFTNAKQGDSAQEIVHIAISAELSASCNNARLAAAEVGGIHVVDSRSLSTGVGLLVLKASDLAKAGASAEEIVNHITALTPSVQASFVVDNMEFLHKGGRCSGLAKFVAGILKIKPMLILKEGKIMVGQKFMGSLSKSIMKYVDAILNQYNTPDYTRIFVTHTHCDPQIVQSVKDRIREVAPQFEEIIETRAGCTITAHCGKGTLGILYINGTV